MFETLPNETTSDATPYWNVGVALGFAFGTGSRYCLIGISGDHAAFVSRKVGNDAVDDFEGLVASSITFLPKKVCI